MEKKAKDQLAILTRHIDNTNFKLFDDKTEKSADAIWAADFSCGRYVYENLPFLSNRKVFSQLSYK